MTVAAFVVVVAAAWLVPTVLWQRARRRLERLERQIVRDTVVYQLNRGSIILGDNEFRMNAERAGLGEIWVWS